MSNMKNFGCFIALLGMIVTLNIQAQEPATEDTLGVHPYIQTQSFAEKTAHWSFYVPFGMTFADMDETGGAKLGSGKDLTVNGGLGVEYNFTPLWGLGAEFNVANYGKGAWNAMRRDEEGQSFGMIYNTSIYLTADFADAFFPYRNKTLVNVYGLVGGGIGFYTFQAQDATSWSSARGLKGYNYDPFIMFGLLLDFNVTRQFGVGLRATYNYYMTDNLDYSSTSGSAADNGRINSNNDGLFTLDAVLRYNIMGNPRSHVRNMSQGTYTEIREKQIIAKYAPELIAEALKSMPHTVDTLVISSRDTIVSKTTQGYIEGQENLYYVYFDNNKTNIKDEGLATIQQVAAILASDATLGIQVGGYADNTGSAERNAILCQERAKNVFNEFVEEYGLDATRAEIRPMGVITSRRGAGSYGPNRRVAIRIVKKEELNKDFLEIKKPVLESTVTESKTDTTANTTVNTPVKKTASIEPLPTHTVKAGETLSGLALNEYGNAECWIYIYSANINRLGGKKSIKAGDELLMPRLTDDQKKINAAEADELYRSLK